MVVRYSSLNRLEKPELTLCNPGSVFENGSGTVRPFQAYARHTSQARPEGDSRFIPLTSIGIGSDDTTGIIQIVQPTADELCEWYTLDGRRLNGKPTAKGVYISNGKKKIIR